ncbi:MAG: NADH-quinone oxidoreductase subunit L [Armatimonadetes bacterium]|nr:NADH-quinone oxidoreductase subunit L [Armatimonadota bacterium]
MMHYTWLVPLIPVVAFVLIIAFGRKLPGQGAYVAIAGMLASLAISLVIAAQWFLMGGAHDNHGLFSVVVQWMPAGSMFIDMGFSVDALSVVMLLVVTVVASMVMIYSVGYMHGDKRYARYFAYLSLFSAAMLTLVIANNILLMFMSWELVGLTSYLLIGFWFEKPSAMRAAKKAFLVNRIGDIGFMAGFILLFTRTHSFNLFGEAGIFENLDKLSATMHVGPWVIPLAAMAGLLLFAGAIGKSAQFPLHVWLPDAMEGPTPVSALIHAATMVAAGVYLVARMYPVYLADTSHIALMAVACVGAFTALFAASIGIAQNDIKKILAYSTVSQLGYMIMSLGVFGYVAAIFHLMTHAFFKAQLFLGSGSVIHGTGTQDIREMGGLKKKMPVTYWTFLISTLALCGLPFTAGGFSKEEILGVAFHTNKFVFYAALLGAFTTAFYMFRLVYMTFHGEPRNHEIHAHESPKVMLVPLIILSTLAIVAGYVGMPFGGGHLNVFEHNTLPVLGEHYAEVLEGVLHHAGYTPGFHWNIFLMGTFAALFGIALATIIWYKPILKVEKLEPAFAWLAKLVENKYYIDEIYQATIIRALMLVAWLMYMFDRWVIDYCIVNGVGYISLLVSAVWGWFDRNIVDGLVNLTGWITGSVGRTLRHLQTGVAQQYVFLLVVALVIISAIVLIGNHSEAAWIPFSR